MPVLFTTFAKFTLHIFLSIIIYNSSPNFLPSLYLALSLAVGHRNVFFSQNSFQTAGFWIADRSRYLACQIFHRHRQFSQIMSLIIHIAWLSLMWTSTDLPPISGICQQFHKTCRRVKIGAKIVQCALGISRRWLLSSSSSFPLWMPSADYCHLLVWEGYVISCKCRVYMLVGWRLWSVQCVLEQCLAPMQWTQSAFLSATVVLWLLFGVARPIPQSSNF